MTHSLCRSSSGFVASVALAVLAIAVPRSAAAVDCGDLVTADIVLDRDLTCAGNGLVVGAHAITIDLGGHTIRGAGPYASPLASGVQAVGFEGVTIRNGEILDFGYGLELANMTDTVVTGVTVRNSQVAVYVTLSTGTRLVSNTVVNGPNYGGFFLGGCTGGEVASNDVSGASDGIAVTNISSGVRVARNRISSTTYHGITVGYFSSATVLDGNVVVGPGGDGLVVLGNATATTLVRNSVTRAGGHGYYIQSDASATQLTANLATRNGIDGFFVDDPTATLTRNIAVRNVGWGIEADPAVTDGGGNVAAGNGAGQCSGITCASR